MKNFRTYLESRTAHLAISYLAIVMAMSIIFSVIIFTVSSNQLGRPLGPGPEKIGIGRPIITDPVIKGLIEERATNGRNELFWSLFSLNIIILIGGAAFSHILAKKTLRPIEIAMDAQSQFVSDASHELRTPLTALQTTNEVALRKKKLSSNDIKTLLEHNVEEIIKLHGLSSALLRLVRSDYTHFKYESVSVQDVVSEATDSVIALAQSKKIVVEDKVPPIKVIANKGSLVQVLRILIENAIKYSPANSKVQLTAEEDGNYVTLHVIDNGIGIAEEEQEKIFTRFYRVDQSRSKVNSSGYGLGLSIAKSICDHQNMKITIKSNGDSGSIFSVQIKIDKSQS